MPLASVSTLPSEESPVFTVAVPAPALFGDELAPLLLVTELAPEVTLDADGLPLVPTGVAPIGVAAMAVPTVRVVAAARLLPEELLLPQAAKDRRQPAARAKTKSAGRDAVLFKSAPSFVNEALTRGSYQCKEGRALQTGQGGDRCSIARRDGLKATVA